MQNEGRTCEKRHYVCEIDVLSIDSSEHVNAIRHGRIKVSSLY
jgi:RecB family endonuclease NucS